MKKIFLSIATLAATISFGQVITNPGVVNGSINFGASYLTYDQGGSLLLRQENSSATPYINFNKFDDSSYARFTYIGSKLWLYGSALNLLGSDGVEITHSEYGDGFGSKIWGEDNGSGNTFLRFDVRNNSTTFTNAMKIRTSDGKVGIGNVSTFPTNSLYNNYKLFVSGGILTDEIRVKLSASGTWADYVFAKDYELKPLSEVEAYITKNGHLPNVPSAAEVKEDGINVADMARIQQEKIEELTLYIIEQNKRIEALEAKMCIK